MRILAKKRKEKYDEEYKSVNCHKDIYFTQDISARAILGIKKCTTKRDNGDKIFLKNHILMILIIKVFRTVVFIFIVISTTFR